MKHRQPDLPLTDEDQMVWFHVYMKFLELCPAASYETWVSMSWLGADRHDADVMLTTERVIAATRDLAGKSGYPRGIIHGIYRQGERQTGIPCMPFESEA